jgi:SAM-dependent methyltransferase
MPAEFDFAGVFDEDYLYFYEGLLGEEASSRAVDVISRLLELGPGSEVLDAPCGHGRIANRLAARGCRVTGFDANPLFLDRARRDAAAQGVEAEYVEGDLRELPWEGRFDGAICWFTSFGYFDDDANRRVAEGYRRALRAGGRLVIDIHSRDAFLKVLLPWNLHQRGDDMLVDRPTYDVLSGRIDTERVIVRGGAVRRTRFFVRTYSFTELRSLLLGAGFAAVRGFGYEGEPLTFDDRRMLVVAERAFPDDAER